MKIKRSKPVIVCGPEGSGTFFMFHVIRHDFGLRAVHLSMPDYHRFWDWRQYEGSKFVVIVRRPDVVTESLIVRHDYIGDPFVPSREEHVKEWHLAIERLAAIPDAHWVFYSAMVANPKVQMDNVAKYLGVPPWKGNLRWTNQDLKWYKVLGIDADLTGWKPDGIIEENEAHSSTG